MKMNLLGLIGILLTGCGQDEEFGFGGPQGPKGKQDTTEEELIDTVETMTDYEVLEDIDCDSVPYVTWETYMKGMLMTHCQGCHASGSPTRYGAPDDVYFDDIEDALFWTDRIRIRTLEIQDMPPAGGIFSEDLYLLQVWLECYSMYE